MSEPGRSKQAVEDFEKDPKISISRTKRVGDLERVAAPDGTKQPEILITSFNAEARVTGRILD